MKAKPHFSHSVPSHTHTWIWRKKLRFEKEHNHPLVVTANGFSTSGDKDKKIEELTMELERQEQLCAAYREKLLSFMNNVEDETEELSSKIQVIVDNQHLFKHHALRKPMSAS
ncbi:hypothetical protein CMV_012710 [Castanea mollissima]|uniref:FAR1 domain-containing protein n=1 Tax=Castanea mollissima TaxID=60419 RepID=A0A8J4QZF9_9ROSI|nr:hypothetical protein CMV_012710 [Castanea mollissima]